MYANYFSIELEKKKIKPIFLALLLTGCVTSVTPPNVSGASFSKAVIGLNDLSDPFQLENPRTR